MTSPARDERKDALRAEAREHLRAAEQCAGDAGDDTLRYLTSMARLEAEQLLGIIGNATDMIDRLRGGTSSH
jgi:hypothetical protein